LSIGRATTEAAVTRAAGGATANGIPAKPGRAEGAEAPVS
jgi:hypothetical protein